MTNTINPSRHILLIILDIQAEIFVEKYTFCGRTDEKAAR